nr:PREDICTED: uncharacterized protein LOC108222377 [Daucus carota subsp. sativus]
MWTGDNNRDTTKHCEYHSTHGHTTESCKSLKYFLERLVRQGHINQYLPRQIVEQGYANSGSGAPGGTQLDKGKNVINVVIGGSQTPPRTNRNEVYTLGSESGSDPEVTFANRDLEGMNPNPGEALVVSVEIGNNVIRKVLVDCGSSVDVIFAHCWDRMKTPELEVEPCPEGQPLYGFGHNAVPVMGTVRVPVLFGTAPKAVVKELKLHVVNLPSAYK